MNGKFKREAAVAYFKVSLRQTLELGYSVTRQRLEPRTV
jgi:hypothetical protein